MFFQGITELANLLGGRVVGPTPAGGPTSYGIDSRSLAAGGLFFALPGTRVDGHEYLAALAEKDAWGAVVQDEAKAEAAGIAAVVVPDVAEALYAAAAARRATLTYPMVAVTGTNGKTTTKDLISQLLGHQLKVASTRGNFNNLLGLPLSLLAAPRDAQVGVFELGMSIPGEIDKLASLLKPRYGVITNVSLAHIEGLGSLEAVRAAKGELVPHLARDGVLYLNGDDPSSRHFAAMAEGRLVRAATTRGVLGAGVHFQVEAVELDGTRGELFLDEPREGRQLRQSIRWPVPGRHMVYPLLFAVLLAQDLALEPDLAGWAEICASGALAATRGRMRVRPAGSAWVIDDSYNANPASLEAALDFLEELEVPGRRFVVLGDMLELGGVSVSCHRAVIDRIHTAKSLAGAWLVGDEFLSAASANSVPPSRVEVHIGETREEAASALAGDLQSGDVVLVKGSRGIGLDLVADELAEDH